MTRDTTTGTSYEKYMESLLTEAEISYNRQVSIGPGRTGKRHRIDLVVESTLVSLKYQNVGGTAEQKIPYECMILDYLVRNFDEYNSAVIVLCGDIGWTLKDFYLSYEFQDEIRTIWPNVNLMTHEQFCETILEKNNVSSIS